MAEQTKTAVLTGASRGIGHATVKRFSAAGWRIITCSRDDVPEECKRDPNWAYHLPADLGDRDSVEKFIRDANEHLEGEGLAALVNNAAQSPKTPYQERLGCLNGDLAAWRAVFELNLFVPLILGRGFAGALHKAKGAVVNITSIAVQMPFPGLAMSSAARSALNQLAMQIVEDHTRGCVRRAIQAEEGDEAIFRAPGGTRTYEVLDVEFKAIEI